MKKINTNKFSMDEVFGNGDMKDIINRSNDDLFSSLEGNKENYTSKEVATIEESETPSKDIPKKDNKKVYNNKQQAKSEASCYSFVCSNSIKETIQAISRREGWTIRDIMEYALNQFIDEYCKAKPGLRIPKNTNSIAKVMSQKKP